MADRSSLNLGNIPSNSNASKLRAQEQREAEFKAVAKGKIVEKKVSIGKMLMDSLFEGTIKGAKDYIIKNIIEPDIKAMFFNSMIGFMSMWIFGEERGRRANTASSVFRSSLDQGHLNTDTNQYAAAARGLPTSQNKSQIVASQDRMLDIVFETRDTAQRVCENILDACKKYDSVNVYTYYTLADVPEEYKNYNLKSIGWVDLTPEEVGVYQTANGWMISLPKPVKISLALKARGQKG